MITHYRIDFISCAHISNSRQNMPINLDLNKQKCDYIFENNRPTIFKYV